MFAREKLQITILAAVGGPLATAILFTWLPAPAAAQSSTTPESPVVSLRVASRTEMSNDKGVAYGVDYKLVNGSSKAIVAWELDCGPDRPFDGRLAYDAYEGYERFQLEHRSLPEGVIEPRKIYFKHLSYSQSYRAGPKDGTHCELAVVVFDDATYEGSTPRADQIFGRRFRVAVDARWGYDALTKALAEPEPKPLPGILKSLQDSARKGLSGPTDRLSAVTHFSVFMHQMGNGVPVSAEQVLEALDFHFQAAMKHLPQSWREKVLAEIDE